MTDLAEKTIKNYTRAIKKISFDLSEKNIVQMSLEEITTEEDLKRKNKMHQTNLLSDSRMIDGALGS